MDKQINPWPVSLERITAPISTANPVGEWLRYDETYDRIKEARREDDPTLPQGVWQTESKKADWEAVSQICSEALATRSKDLQLAAWLLEAWIHLHGAAGAEAGLDLFLALCERFWDTIHPAPENDNLERRLSPFRWLNEKLYLKLKQIPFTRPRSDDVLAYKWIDWENALYQDHLAAQGSGTNGVAGYATSAEVRESIIRSPTDFYESLALTLAGAVGAAQALEATLVEKCGDQSPTLSQFLTVLVEMRAKVETILQERNRSTATNPPEPPAPQTQLAQPGPKPNPTPVHNREEAYRQLAEIADYLLHIEPHSPTPYLVKRAVSWGSMSLTDLVTELVQSADDQRAIFALLGMKKGGD